MFCSITLPEICTALRVTLTGPNLTACPPPAPAGPPCGAPAWFCPSWPSHGCRPSSPSPTGAPPSSRSSLPSSIPWKASSLSWCTASCAERYFTPLLTAFSLFRLVKLLTPVGTAVTDRPKKLFYFWGMELFFTMSLLMLAMCDLHQWFSKWQPLGGAAENLI